MLFFKYMPFPTTDILTVNTDLNVTERRRPVRQLLCAIYLSNFLQVK